MTFVDKFITIVEMFTPSIHFSENDQIFSRADCKKCIVQVLLWHVSNKMLKKYVSFELWYITVAQLLLDLITNKICPVSKNHPVYKIIKNRNIC